MTLEERERIRSASMEAYKGTRYGTCIICGRKDPGPYDLCNDCQDKPIPDYDALHISQLFSLLHKAELLEAEIRLSQMCPDGNIKKAVNEYRDFCFSFGTPGRLYYNGLLEKAERNKEPTQGSLLYILKIYGNA